MATNNLRLSYRAETFEFIASSASRPKRAYGADGNPTGQPKVDAKGRALHGFDAVGRIDGQEVQMQIESPQALPEQIPFGTVWQGAGAPAQVTIRATASGNFGSLVIKAELESFQPVKR
jgi:hypothetical protein